jgi:hypothetical protein
VEKLSSTLDGLQYQASMERQIDFLKKRMREATSVAICPIFNPVKGECT